MSLRAIIPLFLLIIALAGAAIKWPDPSPTSASASNTSTLAGTPPSPESTLNLAGTWTCDDGPIHTSYILNPDHSCTYKIDLPPHIPQPGPKQGTWRIENNDTLVVTFAAPPSPTSLILADPPEIHTIPLDTSAPFFSY